MAPELVLRNRIGTLLLSAPTVTALVGDKVRDDVPSDEEADSLPWICMGPISTRRIEMGGGQPAWSITQRVFAESSETNRDEAWSIARAAIRAVGNQEPPDTAGFVDRLSVTNAGDVIDPGKIKTVFFDVTTVLVEVDDEPDVDVDAG